MSGTLLGPIYTPAKLERITARLCASVVEGSEQTLLVALEEIASRYLTDAVQSSRPPPSSIRKRVCSIRANPSRAALLIEKDTIGKEASYYLWRAAFMIGLRPSNLPELLNSRSLKKMCNVAVASIERNVRRSGKTRHQGNVPLRRLLGDLAGLWIDLAGRLPTITVHGTPSGQFITFAAACLTPINEKYPELLPTRALKPESIRTRFREVERGFAPLKECAERLKNEARFHGSPVRFIRGKY